MKKLFAFCAALMCLLWTKSLIAANEVSIYQATIPVSSQSAEVRNEVAPEALLQVLVKVSGHAAVIDQPDIKASVHNAAQMIQQFSYTPTKDPQKPYYLHLDFDSRGVDQILRRANVPIWGKSRPLILVWIDYQASGRPAEMISSDSLNTIPVLLKEQAERRGLPILLPVMDITDLNQVSSVDITNKAIPKLMQASQRYASDAILIGSITQDANGMVSHWNLILNKDQWEWNITGSAISNILAELVDDIADALAGKYAVMVSKNVQSELTMQVIGITEAEDLSSLIDYLGQLTSVADVQPLKITSSDVLLSIKVRGSKAAFIQTLSVGKKLLPVSDGSEGTVLVYQWNH